MNLSRKQVTLITGCLGFLLFSSISTSSFCQESPGEALSGADLRRDTTVIESEDKYQVVTNKFWDNSFFGAGIGAQLFFSDHNRQMEFGDRLTPAYDVYLGKWFTPGIGVRAAIGGFKVKGVTQNGNHSTGEVYDASKSLEKMEFHYYHLHLDVLFNLTNMLKGYREDRFYTLSPYTGLGWMRSWETPKSEEVGINIGLLNAFRLSKSVDLTLDARGTMVNDRFDGTVGGRMQEGVLTTTLGLVYKLPRREWKKPATSVITYNEAGLVALRDRVNALERDNDALRKQLANSGSSTITDVKVENKMLAAPILVTFPINKSTVSNEARVNLGFFAGVIKKGNPAVVYKVTGYADKGTGNSGFNQRLSKQRAEAIYRVLVNEFGVPPSHLEVAYEGGVENMFYDDPRLNRAVITIAK